MNWWIAIKKRGEEIEVDGPYKSKEEAKRQRKIMKGDAPDYIVGNVIEAKTEEEALEIARTIPGGGAVHN